MKNKTNKTNDRLAMRVDAQLKIDLTKIAKKEKRSMSKQAVIFLEQGIEKYLKK